MKKRSVLLGALGAIALWSSGLGQAQASEVLYNSSGFLQGTQSFVQAFNVATAGTLTVTLTNVAWPQQLASLNLLLTTTSGAMGSEMGVGTASFDVKAGDFFAQWFGTAQGPLNAGVFEMEIEFNPSAGNPVPLPTSIALLLSGLGLLVWHRGAQNGVRGVQAT
jgi:hypothetical protein